MPEPLKRFRTPIVIGLITVVVALAVLVGWISPEGAKASRLGAEKAQLQQQAVQLQQQLATLKSEEQHVQANCATLGKDLAEIPTTPAGAQFLTDITNLAQSSGDPNTPSYTPGAPSKGPGGVSEIPGSLSLTGTFGQLRQFLKGLDTFPRLFTVSTISISGGPVTSGGSFVADASAGYTLALAGDIYYAPAGQANICTAAAAKAAPAAPAAAK